MVSVKLIDFVMSLLEELQTSMVIGPHYHSLSVFLATARSANTSAAMKDIVWWRMFIGMTMQPVFAAWWIYQSNINCLSFMYWQNGLKNMVLKIWSQKIYAQKYGLLDNVVSEKLWSQKWKYGLRKKGGKIFSGQKFCWGGTQTHTLEMKKKIWGAPKFCRNIVERAARSLPLPAPLLAVLLHPCPFWSNILDPSPAIGGRRRSRTWNEDGTVKI